MWKFCVEPNEFTFVAVLTACTRDLDLELGFQIHGVVVKLGFLDYVFVANALMGLYGKSGVLDYVMKVFDHMTQRDIASWNTVISSAVKECMYDRAFELFRSMEEDERFWIDQFTLSSLLSASAGGLALKEGREIHTYTLKGGFGSNLIVNNALIGFYTKCGSVRNVDALFSRMPVKDIVTWTQMITAYMEFGLVDLALRTFYEMPERNSLSYTAILAGFYRNGHGERALNFFLQMLDGGVYVPDSSLTSVISACGLLMDAKIGEQMQGFVLKFGLNECIESALIDMWTRCGRMTDAQKLLNQWPLEKNNSVMWTSIISGHARNGKPEKALSIFHQKHCEGIMAVDEVTLTVVLGICGTLGFLEIGKQLHCYAIKSGYLTEIECGNGLISMHSKCGSMEDSVKIFKRMPNHDIVSWNALISGYLLHRLGDDALSVWEMMDKDVVKPDAVSLLLILSAYRYTKVDLVDHCREFFLAIKSKHNIDPAVEHYAAFVSVLGQWGYLEEAEKFASAAHFENKASIWRALLDSCRLHQDTSVGNRAAKQILALQPQDPSTYTLVSNLYSAAGRWHCSEAVKEEMRVKGFRKHPSRSWIILQNIVHTFHTRDKSHARTKDIYSGLDILILECLKAGYVPDNSYVLHEVEEYQKKDFLLYHSAKLALTYGLLITRRGNPIRIVKNILLCGDCHTFFRYVSIVTKRDIALRDTSGFHHFSNGKCSCRDY
uniref:DYW domain-containing protein n=1 Tax=Kalanchoe fedtschenkoi TaxID=63787 RepID=A0A7N0RGG3_KALFE